MKKYNFLILLFATLVLVSCDDWLEVTPTDRLSEADFYQTEEHAIRAITAAYDPLKHPRAWSLMYYFYFDTFSDRAIHEQINLNNMIINPAMSDIHGMYIKMYKGIYRTTLAIEKIQGLRGNPGIDMDENLKSRLIGEAKYLRAMYYYYLTKIFRYPPLIKETLEDLDVRLTNATQEDLFAFMIEDLEDALQRLPAVYISENNLGRATKGAAHTLLGKVYLYTHQFEKAREQFKAVIDLGIYELIQPKSNDSIDFTDAFRSNFVGDDITNRNGNRYVGENNKESVFEIQYALGGWEVWEGGWQADGQLRTLYFGPEGFRNMVPTSAYVEAFEEAPADHPAGIQYDPRKYVTFYLPGDSIFYVQDVKPGRRWVNGVHTNASISQGFGWGKHFKPTFFDAGTNLNNDYNNVRVFRYSDVLLLFAEADYLTLNNGEGLDALNQVRARAGMPPRGALTPEFIIHERDIELGYETKRYWDLLRWGKYPAPWVNIQDFLPQYNPLRAGYMPIPISEINLSRGALQQNPGF